MTGLLTRKTSIQLWKRLLAKQSTTDTKWTRKRPTVCLTNTVKNVFAYLLRKAFTIGGVGSILTVVTVCSGLVKLMDDYEDERGHKLTEKIRHYRKEKKRRNMIETGVGPGLAWLYYVYDLQHFLSVDIEDKVIKSGLLTEEERKNMPMKLYTVIPRKCRLMDDRGNDKNIDFKGFVKIGNEMEIPVLRIKDGPKMYYCLYDCPTFLGTMNNVNDIQMAEISRSKYSNFDLPWNRNSIVQLFNTDTKLVQLMRFYYALNSILCMKKDFREKTRLILFNESEKQPSEVLLRAIKEDLKDDSLEKTKSKTSLIQNELLSAEEKINVYYDFDVLFYYERGINDEENKTMDKCCTDLQKSIHKVLKESTLKVLSMDNCLGKDWLTNLKYAATKCHWIVFLESNQSQSKLFTSHKVNDAIKRTLESKKVQTVAIVNPRDDMHIFDDLRWVTCIPYQDNDNHILTLWRVLSGSENEIKNSNEFYRKPGEVAVGLAWYYAAYMCNLLTLLTKFAKDNQNTLQSQCKLLFVFPESCNNKDALEPKKNSEESEMNRIDNSNIESFVSGVINLPGFKVIKPKKSPDELQMYGIDDYNQGNSVIWHCEYPKPLTVIHQMKKEGLLTDDQMNSEVQTFYENVHKIMEILLPDQTNNYEFIHCNDTKERPIIDMIINIHQLYNLDDKHEKILSVLFPF